MQRFSVYWINLEACAKRPRRVCLLFLVLLRAGKSSFRRAGLLPRLKRDDRNFLLLPVMRPERAPISGERVFLLRSKVCVEP